MITLEKNWEFIDSKEQHKNHKITELREKACKVSETHLQGALAKDQMPHTLGPWGRSLPGGSAASSIHYDKNTFASSVFWSFSRVNRFHLFTCHPYAQDCQTIGLAAYSGSHNMYVKKRNLLKIERFISLLIYELHPMPKISSIC